MPRRQASPIPSRNWTIETAVTTKTFVRLLDLLAAAFGEDYTFGLNSSYEGGIEMLSWPGKTEVRDRQAEKSMRMRIDGPNGIGTGYWPPVYAATPQRWREDPEHVIYERGLESQMMQALSEYHRRAPTLHGRRRRQRRPSSKLCVQGVASSRAQNGAPEWTKAELDKFWTAMTCAGFTMSGARPGEP
jgi:hypothetical protein